MSGIGVTITRDDATPRLASVQDAAQAARLSTIMARAVGILWKDHLVALNAERHRFGRNYYAQAARSVTTKGVAGFALVTATQVGLRQRLYGGTIRPRKARFLTIPADPAAYGTRAREHHDLDMRMAMNPDGHLQWALVRRVSQALSYVRRKNADGTVRLTVKPGELRAGGQIMFWLTRKVTQEPDPTVLPTREEMLKTAIAAGERTLARDTQRHRGGTTQ